MEAEDVKCDPLIVLADLHFRLSHHVGCQDESKTKDEMLRILESHDMYAYYKFACKDLGWSFSDSFFVKLTASAEEKINAVNAKMAEAEASMGESDISGLQLDRANCYARMGDKEKCEAAFRELDTKVVSLANQFDNQLTLIRFGFAYCDTALVQAAIEKAHGLIALGVDFERKNRLRVYEGLFCIQVREFDRACRLLMSCLATFSAGELVSYVDFVRYTVITGVYSLERVELKKLVESPEVLSVIHMVPHLSELLRSLYDCKYREFFIALGIWSQELLSDRLLARHVPFVMHKLRLKAYSQHFWMASSFRVANTVAAQFLTPYQSVRLDTMAEAFGIEVAFLDRELARLVAAKRLACKIDAVASLVETRWVDSKAQLFQEVIKQGDLLTGRVQKLARIIT